MVDALAADESVYMRLSGAVRAWIENGGDWWYDSPQVALGLRDWHSLDTAPERLQALAVDAPALATHDRRDFRKEHRRA